MNLLIIIMGTFIGIISYRLMRKRLQTRSTLGECSICGNLFQDSQLNLIDELAFCSTDIKYYNSYTWKESKRVLSDPDNPDESIRIYDEKKKLIASGERCFIRVEYVEEKGIVQSIFKLYRKV